jgi:hypothetical protein
MAQSEDKKVESEEVAPPEDLMSEHVVLKRVLPQAAANMMMPICTSRSAAMANAAMKMPIAESGATISVVSCASIRVTLDRSESAV